MHIVRRLVVGLAHQRDEFLRGRQVDGRGRAEMGRINDAVGGILGQIEERRRRDAVRAEARDVPAHLLDLAMDERAFGVTRPFHDGIRVGRADAGQLRREVEVAARVAFLGGDAHAVLLARLDERVEPALAEIVVDVDKPEALELAAFSR